MTVPPTTGTSRPMRDGARGKIPSTNLRLRRVKASKRVGIRRGDGTGGEILEHFPRFAF